MHVGVLPAATALFAAVSALPGGAQPQHFAWVRPGGLDVRTVGASSEGEVFLIDDEDAIWWGEPPVPERLDEAGARAHGWRRRAVPPGFEPLGVAAMTEGTIFVTGRWGRGEKTTLLRADLRESGSAWDDLKPATIGQIYTVAALDRHRVWISGEWRDVFRLEGDRWVREVTPQPLHNDAMKINRDGSGWILAASRTRMALLYRNAEGWKTIATGDAGQWERSGLLFADADEAILQGAHGLERHAVPGREGRSGSLSGPAFPGSGEASLTLTSSDSGWAVGSTGLVRIDAGRQVAVSIANPLPTGAIRDLGSAGVFARDDDSGRMLALREIAEERAGEAPGGGLRRISPYRALTGSGRAYGLTVFRLGAREYLYVVDHDGLNPTFELGALPAALRDGGDTGWRDLSRRLGTLDVRRGSALGQVYDAGAVAGDLDGDGDEDLILVSMYDGIREFRNERDDHFVSWASEAHIASDPMDLASGACLLDADGDGDLDLYVANGLKSDRFHLGDGAGGFEDVTRAAGIDTRDGGSMPACSDLDGDGDVDVAVATGARGLLIQENLGTGASGPRFREHRLLLDRADLDAGPGLSTRNLSSVALADLDGDGLPEMYVAASNACDVFLRNRGALRFEEEGAFLPPGAPCGGSVGGEWLDLDADGGLDLLVAAKDGLRAYAQRDGRLIAAPASGAVNMRSLALVDYDADLDLDVITGNDGRGVVGYENVNDKPASLVVRVVGPPGNRSAIGARLLVREAGGPRIVATREVPGCSSKLLYVGGLAAGARYDLEARIPGRPPRIVAGVSIPFRGEVAFGPGGLRARLADWSWQGARFVRDPWRRRWLVGTVGATALLAAFGLLLHRGQGTLPRDLRALVAAPVLSGVLWAVLPLDSGWPITAASIGIATVLAGAALALGRSRARPRPTPEMLAELGVALRAFKHNQVFGRLSQRLRLDLRNITPQRLAARDAAASYLVEDVRSYREIILPEFPVLGRLAFAAGLEDTRFPSPLRRESAEIRGLERALDEQARVGAPALARVLAALDGTETWMRERAIEADRALALDLRGGVRRWVETRREMVPGPVRLEGGSGDPIYVRFPSEALGSVLDNLLDNAVKAMAGDPAKGIHVEILNGAGSRPRLVFRDDGPGVDPAVRPKLFTFGADGAAGHGFGLYFARRTAGRFGATIELVEDAPPGATFRLDFDAVEEERT